MQLLNPFISQCLNLFVTFQRNCGGLGVEFEDFKHNLKVSSPNIGFEPASSGAQPRNQLDVALDKIDDINLILVRVLRDFFRFCDMKVSEETPQEDADTNGAHFKVAKPIRKRFLRDRYLVLWLTYDLDFFKVGVAAELNVLEEARDLIIFRVQLRFMLLLIFLAIFLILLFLPFLPHICWNRVCRIKPV